MRNKTILIILMSVFLLTSCKEPQKIEKSNFIFELPRQKVFVKAVMYEDYLFSLSFARDSLLLDEKKDYVEMYSSHDLKVAVTSSTIYTYTLSVIRETNTNAFKSKNYLPRYSTKEFLKDSEQHNYDYINIDTKSFRVSVNGEVIKEGAKFLHLDDDD